jgi:DNA-binding NtrC family response regulator
MNRILVVGDVPLLHEVTSVVLTGDGHLVSHAPDAATGQAMLSEAPFDLVITDLSGPSALRIDFMEHLYRNYREVKRLVITGQTTPDAVIDMLRKKACDFLAKPFTVDELRDAVSSVLTKSAGAAIEIVSTTPG